MQKEIQKLFQLSSNKCCVKDCPEKPQWQPIFLIYAPCEDSSCSIPHFNSPGVMIQDGAYCEAHKKALKIDDMVPDAFWEKLCNDFKSRGLAEPRRDWTAISFHKVPDNVTVMGPRLVPKNPEPLPGA